MLECSKTRNFSPILYCCSTSLPSLSVTVEKRKMHCALIGQLGQCVVFGQPASRLFGKCHTPYHNREFQHNTNITQLDLTPSGFNSPKCMVWQTLTMSFNFTTVLHIFINSWQYHTGAAAILKYHNKAHLFTP